MWVSVSRSVNVSMHTDEPHDMISGARDGAGAGAGAAPWKLGFRSSRAFVISVVAIAVFTVSSVSLVMVGWN